MDTDKTNEKGDKAQSADSGCAPTGHGMFEMMSKCCTGQDGSPDCSAIMKGMMEAMKGHSGCSPKTGDVGPERRGK
jgi:hypothetical protein